MDCIRNVTQRCHVGHDSGREDDKSLMFIGCGWSAGVCVELIELRVVQIAALGWRPGSVGRHGDHTPVGVLLSTVFGKASSSLPNTAMAMPAAPGLEPDRGVYILFLCHSGARLRRSPVPGTGRRRMGAGGKRGRASSEEGRARRRKEGMIKRCKPETRRRSARIRERSFDPWRMDYPTAAEEAFSAE